VIHGIAHMTESARIEIRVEANSLGGTDIVVADNGKGIGPKEMTEIESEFRDGSDRNAYGLRNVYSRIKLLYGDGADLFLRSEPGKGTEARLRLTGEAKIDGR